MLLQARTKQSARKVIVQGGECSTIDGCRSPVRTLFNGIPLCVVHYAETTMISEAPAVNVGVLSKNGKHSTKRPALAWTVSLFDLWCALPATPGHSIHGRAYKMLNPSWYVSTHVLLSADTDGDVTSSPVSQRSNTSDKPALKCSVTTELLLVSSLAFSVHNKTRQTRELEFLVLFSSTNTLPLETASGGASCPMHH